MTPQDHIERNKSVYSLEKWNSKNPRYWFLIEAQQKKQLFEMFERRKNEVQDELDKKFNEIREQHKEIREQHKEIREQHKEIRETINRLETMQSYSTELEEKNNIPPKEINFFSSFINWLVSYINKYFESRRHYSFFSEKIGETSLESNNKLASAMSP